MKRPYETGPDSGNSCKGDNVKEQTNRRTLNIILSLTLSCSALLLTPGCGSNGSGAAPAVESSASFTRQAKLTTLQVVPAPSLPDAAAATPGGTASFTTYSTGKLRGSVALTGFTSSAAVTSVNIQDGDVGSAGPVVILLVADAARVVWSLPANISLTEAQRARFKAGGYYVNAVTAANGGGVIRGQLMSYADNIQPIFTANCIGCHKPFGIGQFSLVAGESYANLLNTGGSLFVNAGDSAGSILYQRISGTSAGPQMPLGGKPLVANDQNLIKVWIDMGAVNN